MIWCGEMLLMFPQQHEDSWRPPTPTHTGCFHSSGVQRLFPLYPCLHPPSFHRCFHSSICTQRSLALLCCISGSPLWLCLWGQRIRHIKRTSSLAPPASLCRHVCASAIPSIYLHTCPPLYTALVIQSEDFLLICSLEAVFPEEAVLQQIHASLHNARVRTYKSQCAQDLVYILMVPAYAQDAVAVESLVLPVGCFQSSSLASLSHIHVCISFCRLLSCCRSQSLSLFVSASQFPNPVQTHASEGQKLSERQWG